MSFCVDSLLGNRLFILNWITRVILGRKRYSFLPIPRRLQVVSALLGLLSPRQKMDLFSRDDIRPAIAECFKIFRKLGGAVRRSVFLGRRTPDHGA